jgi:hypothetical protein
MKKLSLLWLGIVLLLAAGCANLTVANTGTVSLKLSGAGGSLFTGYYVKDGQRTKFSGAVPWKFESAGISRFEIVKTNPSDSISLEMHYKDASANVTDGMALGPGILGARGRVRSGFMLTAIRP